MVRVDRRDYLMGLPAGAGLVAVPVFITEPRGAPAGRWALRLISTGAARVRNGGC